MHTGIPYLLASHHDVDHVHLLFQLGHLIEGIEVFRELERLFVDKLVLPVVRPVLPDALPLQRQSKTELNQDSSPQPHHKTTNLILTPYRERADLLLGHRGVSVAPPASRVAADGARGAEASMLLVKAHHLEGVGKGHLHRRRYFIY